VHMFLPACNEAVVVCDELSMAVVVCDELLEHGTASHDVMVIRLYSVASTQHME
jgi:hypothetical protein